MLSLLKNRIISIKLKSFYLPLLILLLYPSSAQSQSECEIIIEPVWAQARELIVKMEKDPFSKALGIYIKDLRDLEGELDRWKVKANDMMNKQCLPYVANSARFEARLVIYTPKCTGEIPDTSTYNWCITENQTLNSWKVQLDNQKTQLDSTASSLNVWGANLLQQENKAYQRAQDVFGNHENAFRAFALFNAKADISDCEAMARMYDALAKRTHNLSEFVEIASKVLGDAGGARAVRFGESGFRNRYVDRISSNQVRHFTGYFVAGIRFSGPTFTQIIADLRDSTEPGDRELGIMAANLGDKYDQNPLLLKGVGGAIRSTICR